MAVRTDPRNARLQDSPELARSLGDGVEHRTEALLPDDGRETGLDSSTFELSNVSPRHEAEKGKLYSYH